MRVCGRCGREFEQPEASIDGVPYCHPRYRIGRSCYVKESYEQAFDLPRGTES